MMYAYVVLGIDREHNTVVCGVFASHEDALPTVRKIRSEGNEAVVQQYEVGGRRIASWFYDDCGEGNYYVHPIRE